MSKSMEEIQKEFFNKLRRYHYYIERQEENARQIDQAEQQLRRLKEENSDINEKIKASYKLLLEPLNFVFGIKFDDYENDV